jgi:(p)ppGpp synthase/HD superfamily hydrolase
MTTTRLQKIDALAAQLHEGQTRNNSDLPYITHPRAVMNIATQGSSMKYNDKFVEHVAAVALLHDTLEDTDVGQTRLFDLVMGCGWSSIETNAIVHDVSLLTRLNKSQPILDYLRGIKGSFAAVIVKRADLEHNLSDLKPGNLRDKYHLCLDFLPELP